MITRSRAIHLFAGGALASPTVTTSADGDQPNAECIDIGESRRTMAIGDSHVGVLEGVATLIVCSKDSTVRRFNLPRPPLDRVPWGWLTQDPPSQPLVASGFTVGDVVWSSTPDDLLALIAVGEYAVLLSYIRFEKSYLTRFHLPTTTFETRVVGAGNDYRGVFVVPPGDLIVVRSDAAQIRIPW
jgi:hypothetical protein